MACPDMVGTVRSYVPQDLVDARRAHCCGTETMIDAEITSRANGFSPESLGKVFIRLQLRAGVQGESSLNFF